MTPHQQNELLRILDANANRAGEGLRVCEDYVRFCLQDRHLAQLLKQLRHDLHAILASISVTRRTAARSTPTDIGTTISTSDEGYRDSSHVIATASMKRTEQALRCLEEYSKPISADVASQLETLRYRTYTIHAAISSTEANRQRLADAQIYVLMDAGEDESSFRNRIGQLVDVGVDIVQLRDKTCDDNVLLERAQIAHQKTHNAETLLIINDRPDIALLSGADGVHVGQDDVAVVDVRRVVGADMLIGASTHSIEQAQQAVLDGANYIGCGPTFPSQTKSFEDFAGVSFLREVSHSISLPTFAIGGITTDNITEVVATGIRRIAISHAVDTPDRERLNKTIERFRIALRAENVR